MALNYLLDEHLRGPLWRAICRENASRSDGIDVVRVGDVEVPSLGMPDSELLIWAETAGRIVVTFDGSTMPQHLAEHLQAGRQLPGIFVIRSHTSLKDVVEFLVFAAYASESFEWTDRIVYIP